MRKTVIFMAVLIFISFASAQESEQSAYSDLNDGDFASSIRNGKYSMSDPWVADEVGRRTQANPSFLNDNPDLKKEFFAMHNINDEGANIKSYKNGIVDTGATTFDINQIKKFFPGAALTKEGDLVLNPGLRDQLRIRGSTNVDQNGRLYVDGTLTIGANNNFLSFSGMQYDPSIQRVSSQTVPCLSTNCAPPDVFLASDEYKLRFIGSLTRTPTGFQIDPNTQVYPYFTDAAGQIREFKLKTYPQPIDLLRALNLCSGGLNCVEVTPNDVNIRVQRGAVITASYNPTEQTPASQVLYSTKGPPQTNYRVSDPNGETAYYSNGLITRCAVSGCKDVGNGFNAAYQITQREYEELAKPVNQPSELDEAAKIVKAATNPSLQIGSTTISAKGKIDEKRLFQGKLPVYKGSVSARGNIVSGTWGINLNVNQHGSLEVKAELTFPFSNK